MFKLVIQDDEGKTTVVPLIRDEITIGRKEGNTIRLTERNVSRRHARILRANGEVQIEDLGSYNGIRVNNARIAERVALRVSDQVQIGDYKLYLKAEGVEQVDEARTMPIERIDASATDIIPAVTAPTIPLGVPTAASTRPAAAVAAAAAPAAPAAPTAPQLVGNPNRTLVAIADTDPAGRPVATAATVAALTTPVGYGKLVVLSSNFAGKEFELTRPQMIIGRTDENDIVINHRSISRNHAKLVRETDTGRYTVSDLQSSNGVRVNGQDYGKVELRRGDVVDLGHVRLRFVEAGEDFVFARDAVITDVPDVGSKKGLLVALLLGVVVVGSIGVYFGVLKNDGKKVDTIADSGSGTDHSIDDGSGSGPGSQVAEVGSGSNTEVTPPIEIDAGVAEGSSADDIKLECLRYAADKNWTELESCSNRLAAGDPTTAKSLRLKAVTENKNDSAGRNLDIALKASDLKAAKRELEKITADSVYKADATARYKAAESELTSDFERKARSLASDKKCSALKDLVREASSAGVSLRSIRCTEAVAVRPPPNTTNNGSNTAPPPEKCDADAAKAKGDNYLSTGMDAAALAAFETSMRCKGDSSVTRLAYIAACRSKNAAKARLYYGRLPAAQQTNSITQICVRVGITIP